MVVKVKELERWLRKLDENDLIATITYSDGTKCLRAYIPNGGGRDYPELKM
jgi:hypothetical protein